MMSRRNFLALIPGALAGTAILATRGRSSSVDASAPGTPSGGPPRPTVLAEVRDLVRKERTGGVVQFAQAYPLPSHRTGIVTWLPEAGSRLRSGDVAWRIDDQPTVVIDGVHPAWRPMSAGTEGPDVEQLQRYLVANGYADDLEGDGDFGRATRDAVRNWQDAMALRKTGVVALGDVVFDSLPRRVSEQLADIGHPTSGPIIAVSDVAPLVTAALDPADRALVEVGAPVTVELPDDSIVSGVVTRIESGTPTPDGRPRIDLVVEIGEEAATWLGAPAVVVLERRIAGEVLAVPVAAILALTDGTYAVERASGSATELVPVELGAAAEGWVQVNGNITAGDELVVGT